MTKSIVFSDALDFDRALAIQKYFEGRIKVSFVFGYYLVAELKRIAAVMTHTVI